MGAGNVVGMSADKFVAKRVIGSFSGDVEPESDATGDQRETDATDGGLGGGSTSGTTDPNSLGSDAPYGYTPTGRRKRAPGGKRNTTRESGASREGAKQATSDIAELLTLVHWGIATALKEESIELSPDEAEKLAKSITRLTELYGNIPGMDEKTRAWVNLGITTSTIYGTRIIAAKMRKPKRPTVINTGMHNVG
jgi:hypothetical protein